MLQIRITGKRGEGKTTALVAVFKLDANGILVFPTAAAREYALRFWPELCDLRTTLPFNVDNSLRGRPEARLYVDEIERTELSEYARSRVVAWSGE